MTCAQARNRGASHPMPDVIFGKRKILENVYVSPTGFTNSADAWRDFYRIDYVNNWRDGWLRAPGDSEGIFIDDNDNKYYAYAHRGLYV